MNKRIEIPFLDEWEQSMLLGRKIMTSRNKKYGDEGDVFEAFGSQFELLEVKRRKLREVAFIHYDAEGCADPEHFIEIWNKLHPRKGYQPEQLVWSHLFRSIKCGN